MSFQTYTIYTANKGRFTFFLDKLICLEKSIDKEDAAKKFSNALEQWNNDVKSNIQKISDGCAPLELTDPITGIKFDWAPTDENMSKDNALDMYQLYSDEINKIAQERAGKKPQQEDFLKYKFTIKLMNNECRYITEEDYENITIIINQLAKNEKF